MDPKPQAACKTLVNPGPGLAARPMRAALAAADQADDAIIIPT